MRAHVLVCRGPDCTSRGSQDVYTEMASQCAAQGLVDEVVQTQSGCIGPLCGSGPVVCCYPTGAWYAPYFLFWIWVMAVSVQLIRGRLGWGGQP